MKGNKSKKTLILVLIAIVMLFMLKAEVFAAEKSGTAQTTTKNGGTISWSFTANDDTKQITNLKCTNPEGISGEIEVPSIIEVEGVEYTVVSLGSNAFQGASAITKVTIPETILSIRDDNSIWSGGVLEENGCFENCTSLKEVILPNLSKINKDFFKKCTSLTTVIIPNSVTAIDNNAFYGCSSLEEIIIPDSVTTIGEDAFNRCTNLSSLTISNSVQELAEGVFAECKSLTEVVIPDSVVSIQSDYSYRGAFYNCEALQKVTIPDTVTYIGKYAFQNCGKGKLGLFVKQGSYAETWAKTNEVTYSYGDGTSQSSNEQDKNQESDNKEQKPQTQTPSTEQQIPADDGKDETVTPASKIPQTGEKYGIFIVTGIVLVVGAIGVIRYKKYKGI